jgi:hypothetical protein
MNELRRVIMEHGEDGFRAEAARIARLPVRSVPPDVAAVPVMVAHDPGAVEVALQQVRRTRERAESRIAIADPSKRRHVWTVHEMELLRRGMERHRNQRDTEGPASVFDRILTDPEFSELRHLSRVALIKRWSRMQRNKKEGLGELRRNSNFTPAEEEALLLGYLRYRHASHLWASVMRDPDFSAALVGRTNAYLSVKWKRMQLNGGVQEVLERLQKKGLALGEVV